MTIYVLVKTLTGLRKTYEMEDTAAMRDLYAKFCAETHLPLRDVDLVVDTPGLRLPPYYLRDGALPLAIICLNKGSTAAAPCTFTAFVYGGLFGPAPNIEKINMALV